MDSQRELEIVCSGAHNLHNTLAPPVEIYHNQQVFDHLVALFDSTLRNSPKAIGSHSFQAFGAIALLVVEIKLEEGNDAQRLDAIAQVIAECESLHHMVFLPLSVPFLTRGARTDCDLTNRSQQYSLPLHCIFIHNGSFEFFKFERTPTSSFVRGAFPGNPTHLQHGLKLPDFVNAESSLPFILQLRPLCEIIFDMLLVAYIAGLTAYYDQCKETEGENRTRSLRPAEQALAVFREAEAQREAGELDLADGTVDRGLLALQERCDKFSASYQSFLTLPPQYRSSAEFL